MADSTLTDPRPPTSARISLDSVRQAATALIKWKSTKSVTENPNLLADEEYFYLTLTLKKIPPNGRVNPYKIPLPHPLHLASETELCLIIDDREKSKLTKADAKKKIEADDIGVGKILRLTKLKTDYHAFEAKRKLCDSYDMFLVDKRIIPIMPKLLGKQFFKKKKIPSSIDLTHKNWKEQISRAISSGLFYLRTGTCSVVKVARISMDVEEIVENVMAAVNGIVEIVPKKWDGVRSFHLKLSESLSLPIYQALPDLKLKISGIERVEEKNIADEEAVPGDGKKDKNVTKKKSKKGKITNESLELTNGSELECDEEENNNVESEDDEPVVQESPFKKRKKSSDKLEKPVSKKKAKKDVNLSKKDDTQQKKKNNSDVPEKIVEKKLKVLKTSKNENVVAAKDKLSAKKLKSEGTNLKDKKKSKTAK